jgi:hypothetical protein
MHGCHDSGHGTASVGDGLHPGRPIDMLRPGCATPARATADAMTD